MSWLRGILVHLCCVLLAAPIGWCCLLPTAGAAEQPGKSHCCRRAEEKPAPAKEPKTPPPSRACCCDPALVPAASQSTVKNPVQAFATAPVLIQSFASLVSAPAFDQPVRHDRPPPIHVLHCRWIC